MKLINPTDDELNAAFAEKVAGWRLTIEGESHPWWFVSGKPHLPLYETPRFATSADAVLPYFEASKVHMEFAHWGGLWRIHKENDKQMMSPFVEDKSLPRAATIALLRAHGVEIEFTK